MSNAIRALFPGVDGVPGGRPAPVVHRVPSVRPIPVARNLTTRRFPIAVSSRRPRSSQLLAPAVLPAAMAAVIGTAALLRGRYLRWGTTSEEQDRALAGDVLLPVVDHSTTRAITINAAAQDIWPWIVQLGQGRGGFYSYDWLENRVARIDIHNADRIVPEWQQITVGAEVRLAPEVRLRVAALEPGRALVLRGSVPMGQVAPPYEFTWAFVLVPQPDDTTRLVVRERYRYTHRWAAMIVQPAQLVSCFMSPKMLRGIKTRAEQTPTRPAPNGSARRPPQVRADRNVQTPALPT